MLVKAPWTDQQVDALNAWQRLGYVHPYTCPHRGDPGHFPDAVLTAFNHGWWCPDCGYRQDWALDVMADRTKHPTNPLELLKGRK